ncbi:MAG TPA: FliH/SctL family protein [Planctomycetaceae bacterium]|nr:FliH/SctL family protein [Planctomycetaceae bacterium]
MTVPSSPRILKADSHHGSGAGIAFNYEDLRRRCDEQLEQVRGQARELIETARRDAESLRRRALEDGRAAGLREGLAEAAREIETRAADVAQRLVEERLGTVLPALQSAAAALALERDRWLVEWENTAVRLGIAVAQKLLRHQLDAHPDAGRELLAQSLQLASGSAHVTVRLNPADLERLGDRAADVIRSLASCGRASVSPDASLSRGSAVIDTGPGTIDARIETQLERIASELLQEE